ncbi:MAG TPA: hypothetical protein DCF33_07435 [Saprospirales bacterium]|nr:hypothetical protein [Saprospirales bacterium]
MKNLKNLFLAVFAVSMTALTGCLHIIEEATFRNNGSGSYKMTLDMSEMKGMMDMFKGMAGDSTLTSGLEMGGDSTSIQTEGDYTPPSTTDAPEVEDPMGGLGEQMSSVAATIRGVDGISNVVEIKDTSNFQFGYSFDFVSVEALNRALRIINKDKYDSKVEEVFRYKGKSFERLGTGDIGEEMKKAMMNTGDEAEEGSMDMVKRFLADMSYKQIYHFPDRTVKKADNKLGEISDEGHTLTINIKPFDEEQQKKKASVATKVKLK